MGQTSFSVGADRACYAPGAGRLISFAAVIQPPASSPERVRSRHVVLVLDVSSSMRGTPLAQAKRAAARIAGHLACGDHISVVTFADDAQLLVDHQPLGSDAAATLRPLQDAEPGYGTNFGAALELLASLCASHPPSDVVWLSDGQPTRGARHLDQLAPLARGLAPSVLHTIGVGPHATPTLLRTLAEAGAGYFTQVDETRTDPLQVFGAVLGALLSKVGHDAWVQIRTAPHARLHRLYTRRPFELEPSPAPVCGGSARVRIGDLVAGEPIYLCFAHHAQLPCPDDTVALLDLSYLPTSAGTSGRRLLLEAPARCSVAEGPSALEPRVLVPLLCARAGVYLHDCSVERTQPRHVVAAWLHARHGALAELARTAQVDDVPRVVAALRLLLEAADRLTSGGCRAAANNEAAIAGHSVIHGHNARLDSVLPDAPLRAFSRPSQVRGSELASRIDPPARET